MPIEFHCDACTKLLRVPDGSGGKQCQCPGCGTLLDIPTPPPSEPMRTPSVPPGSDIALCIPCPKCKHELICDPSLVGTKGQCRSCKHIFVITDLPTEDSEATAAAINWVFSCPKCAQLFEGNESMRGKRGKCHACGEVFTIDLRVADSIASAPATEQAKTPTQSAPSNSFDSFDGELTLDAPLEDFPVEQQPASTFTTPGTVVSKAGPRDKRPIEFNCKNCKGRMEVPGIAANQLTHCPHCKRQQTIPDESEATVEELAAADPWNDLGAFGGAPLDAPQSNPFGDTLYPPPMPMMPMPGSRRSSSSNDNSWMYVVAGIFISLSALVSLAFEGFEILMSVMGFAAAKYVDKIQTSTAFWQVLIASLMFLPSLFQLIGGIALARRRGLIMARIAAVICCLPLPCVCIVVNVPFGIWGCVLTFSRDAHREFS